MQQHPRVRSEVMMLHLSLLKWRGWPCAAHRQCVDCTYQGCWRCRAHERCRQWTGPLLCQADWHQWLQLYLLTVYWWESRHDWMWHPFHGIPLPSGEQTHGQNQRSSQIRLSILLLGNICVCKDHNTSSKHPTLSLAGADKQYEQHKLPSHCCTCIWNSGQKPVWLPRAREIWPLICLRYLTNITEHSLWTEYHEAGMHSNYQLKHADPRKTICQRCETAVNNSTNQEG